jgi:hypothetical protein
MSRKISIEYESDSDSDFEEFYRNAIKESKRCRNIIDIEINNIRSFKERESLYKDDIQYVENPSKKRNTVCTIM